MLLFHTDNLPNHGLDRIFAIAKQTGFDGIEIGINRNYDTHDAAYLKTLEQRHQINIMAFSITPKSEEKSVEPYHNCVREFNQIAMNLPVPQTLAHKYKKWFTDIAPKVAQKYKLKLNRKNVPTETVMGFLPGRSGNSIQDLKSKGSVCLDLTALALSNEEIMKTIDLLGTHLSHVYLSNVYRSQNYYPLQKGVLPLESFLSKLARLGYRGHFTLNVHGRYMHENDEKQLIETLRDTKDYFDKYFTNERVDR